MILQLIILSGAAFGVFWTIKTKKTFPAIITLGMVAGIIVSVIPVKNWFMAGFYIYLGFAALAFIYGLVVKDLKIGARVVICLMAAGIITYFIWVTNHWHGNVLVAPILVLAMALVALIKKFKLKNEWGFLAILSMDAIAQLVENYLKAN